jgi:hypothetical protein
MHRSIEGTEALLRRRQSLTKSQWGEFGSIPVPIRVTALQIVGPPSKPSKKVTRKVSLAWCELPDRLLTGGAFSEQVSGELQLGSTELIDFIRRNAIISETTSKVK